MDIFHSTECELCNIKIVDTELKKHIREKHGGEPCLHCAGMFPTKVELAQHMRSDHLVACKECDLRFLTEELLEKHQQESHPFLLCMEEDCDEGFVTEQQLKKHKDKKHSNPNKFLTFGGGMFMMMMVVDEPKAGEDEGGLDPLDEVEEELECEGVGDHQGIVGEIIGDIVDREGARSTFFCKKK